MPKLKIKKIKKERAGYIYRPGSEYTCEECVFYDNGICKMFKGDNKVDEDGSCILWQKDKSGVVSPNIATTTKGETGYEVNEYGFSCKRCEYFLGDACKKVAGKIDEDACCNIWDKD